MADIYRPDLHTILVDVKNISLVGTEYLWVRAAGVLDRLDYGQCFFLQLNDLKMSAIKVTSAAIVVAAIMTTCKGMSFLLVCIVYCLNIWYDTALDGLITMV